MNNSVFDDHGNLVFYVAGHRVRDAQGTLLGDIGLGATSGGYNPEIAICEVPGNCSQYYVILAEDYPFGTYLRYAKVDISTNPISLIQPPGPPIQLSSGGAVLAVSSFVKKLNQPNTRWLYTLSGAGNLNRFVIDQNGITFDLNIFTSTSLYAAFPTLSSTGSTFFSREGEIFGDCFAWGDANHPLAYIVRFDPATGVPFWAKEYALPPGNRVYGFEFGPGNSVQDFFVAIGGRRATEGIYQVDISSGSYTKLTPSGGRTYTNTQIERSASGRYYVVSDIGKLGSFTPGSGVINPENVNSLALLTPVWGPNTPPIYTLPDQVDKETFAAEPAATVQSYTINQVPLESAPTVVPEFYECNPLTLQATVADAVTYSLQIENLPGTPPLLIQTGNGPLTGSFITENLLNISLSIQAGSPTLLQNQTGTYRVTLTLNTDCAGSTTREGVFKLEASPDPATAQIAMIPGCQGCPTCYSQDLAAPCVVGVAGGSLEITNVANIDYYRIDELAEINCATGNVIETLYTEANNSNPPPTSFSINAFDIQLPNSPNIPWTGTGYFFNNATAVANRCYRLTVVVGNVCGEVSDFTYFKPSGQFRLANPATSVQEPIHEAKVSLFPNPVASNAMLSYELTTPASVEVSFSDLSGQVVARESFPQQMAGTHQQKVNLSSLPSGVYLYQIHMADEVKMGRIVKL